MVNGAQLVTGAQRNRRDRGFTLMELMIVMAIITILAGVGLAMYGNSVTRSKEAVLAEDLFQLRDSIDQYYADKRKYPASLQTLVEERYLRAVPTDPFTGSSETWQTVMSDPEPGNPSAEPGIFDVKSGADQVGLNGKPYAEW